MTEYRIDDLAREAGTTVRNVRVYQDRGLLPPPRKKGRTGYYSEAHLARLRLITRLLERGYTFATIGELLTASEKDLRVEDILGLGDVLSQPWSDESPTTLSLVELRRVFGSEATPANLARVCELGFLRRTGASYEVSSPRLVAAARDLVAAGFAMTDVIELAGSVQADIEHVAGQFVSLIAEHYLPTSAATPAISSEHLAEAAALINQVRPHASEAVHAIFARAMEKEISRAFDQLAKRFNEPRPGAAGEAAAG